MARPNDVRFGLFLLLSVAAFYARPSTAQFDLFEQESTEYKGKLLGTFNSYHHQV